MSFFLALFCPGMSQCPPLGGGVGHGTFWLMVCASEPSSFRKASCLFPPLSWTSYAPTPLPPTSRPTVTAARGKTWDLLRPLVRFWLGLLGMALGIGGFLAVQTLFFDTPLSSLRTEAEGVLLALQLVSALLTSGSRFLSGLQPQWSE